MFLVTRVLVAKLMITNRLIIPLLCAASAVAFARGATGNRSTLASSSAANASDAAVTSRLTVHAGDVVEFTLDVRNNTGKMLELRFPSGMTHDFVVQDASGREVWRWSRERLFTQGIQNKLVKSRDVAVFAESWDSRDLHGKFTAFATLPSENYPIDERVEFELK